MSITEQPPQTEFEESAAPLPPEITEQFIESERAWHEWTLIGAGLACLLSAIAIIVALVALSAGGSTHTTFVTTPAPGGAAAATPAVAPQALTIGVKADDEHGRRGPDGKWHDAFLPADFSVHAGALVTITILNYDGGPHTFTAPGLHVNAIIPGNGALGHPQRITFSFRAPKSPGSYQWWCAVPCDPWAMTHDGYMRGVVKVIA